jgi:Spy/CpxP family protein refolding chaperone
MERFVAALLGLAAVACAEMTAIRPLGDVPQPLREYLDLTADQYSAIRQINVKYNAFYGAQQPRMAELDLQLTELRGAASPDEAAMGRVLREIEDLRKKLEAAMNAARKDAQAVLTTGQLTKLSALQDAADLGPRVQDALCANLVLGELVMSTTTRARAPVMSVFSNSVPGEICPPATDPRIPRPR